MVRRCASVGGAGPARRACVRACVRVCWQRVGTKKNEQKTYPVTQAELPWLVDELDGVAESAGADPTAVFAASIEELAPVAAPVGRCSDLVAGPPATADGHLWVAHNNDLGPETEDDLVAIEWRLPGDPTLFTLGIGPWISVGFNAAGLALTGNELSPSDNRVGCSCI